MYLISLYFDEKTNRILQKYIDRVAQATGNNFMTDNHVPPHITISQIEARSGQDLIPAFQSLGEHLQCCEAVPELTDLNDKAQSNEQQSGLACSDENLLLSYQSLKNEVQRGTSQRCVQQSCAARPGEMRSAEIFFVTVGQLLPYVIYVAPVLNPYLQTLSEIVYEQVKDIEDVSVSRFYRPGSWLPHVTIGKKLDRQQMKAAFDCMYNSFTPFSGKITSIGLASVNPHHDICTIPLIY